MANPARGIRLTAAAIALAAIVAAPHALARPAGPAAGRGDHPACADSDAILGTAGDDVLEGTDGDDVICGLGGDDRIDGGGGDDVLIGGGGSDALTGAAGSDFCFGGDGDDRYSNCEQCPTQAAATHISFTRLNGQSGNGLFKILPNGKHERKLSGRLEPPYTGHGYAGAWSPDGKRIAFSGGESPTYLYTAKANGADRERITEMSASFTPDWSPNGQTIAFELEDTSVEEFDVYRVPSDGGEATRLTTSEFGRFHPHWSPDGNLIALEGNNDGYSRRALVMNPDGSGEQELLPGTLSSSPVWAPDGEHIAFVGARGEDEGRNTPTDIYVVRPNGSDLTRITDMGGVADQPQWSPDGRKIVFTRRANGTDVYSINPDGTQLRRLTNDRATETGMRWSPDATKILFSRERKNDFGLWIMDADGGGERKITDSNKDEIEAQWRPRDCT